MPEPLPPPLDRATGEPHPGERVWSLEKDGSEISAAVSFGPYGWELRLFLDRFFRYAHRHETRALAIDDAISCREQFEGIGWITRSSIEAVDASPSPQVSPNAVEWIG